MCSILTRILNITDKLETQLDCFSWEYLNSKVCMEKPTTKRALKKKIQRDINETHIYEKWLWKISRKVYVPANAICSVDFNNKKTIKKKCVLFFIEICVKFGRPKLFLSIM